MLPFGKPLTLRHHALRAVCRVFLLLLSSGLALTSCQPAENQDGSPTDAAPSDAAAPLEVRDVVVQGASGADTAAAYFEVVNRAATADRLLSVETDAARLAEPHETVVEGDVVRMVARPEGFEVPAEGTLRLEPGGKHLMLVEPTWDPSKPVSLTLTFEHAGEITVTAEPQEGAGAMDHDMMDHGAMDHGSMDHDAMGHDAMDHGAMDEEEKTQDGEGPQPAMETEGVDVSSLDGALPVASVARPAPVADRAPRTPRNRGAPATHRALLG